MKYDQNKRILFDISTKTVKKISTIDHNVQIKFLVLMLLIASISVIGAANAHKSEVIGDYKVEIGWDKEPPIVGMNNKITVMITHASPEEKAAAGEATHDEAEHEHAEGISGLASSMDVTVTLNGEKTALIMTEDEEIPGLYLGEFTPPTSGFPTVHLFVEIDGDPLEIDIHPEKAEDGAVIRTATSDCSINVDVITTAPTADEDMLIKVEFTDAQGNPIEHVNYDIVAMQDGNEVLTESTAHSHEGDTKHSTETLRSNDPVDIQVTILGIGLPDDEANWSGPMGDTISLNVVPEFGPIAMIVFAVATVSIVAMAAKSKIIPKL